MFERYQITTVVYRYVQHVRNTYEVGKQQNTTLVLRFKTNLGPYSKIKKNIFWFEIDNNFLIEKNLLELYILFK